MNRILLDTSAYSALFRKHQAIVQLVESAESLYLTPIVLGELKAGFLLGRRGEENESSLREFLQSPRVSVLAINDETADRWAIIAAFLKRPAPRLPPTICGLPPALCSMGFRS